MMTLREEPKITKVYHFNNNMMMVFDQHGNQMPDYQGPYEQVIEKIKSVYAGPIETGSYRA